MAGDGDAERGGVEGVGGGGVDGPFEDGGRGAGLDG